MEKLSMIGTNFRGNRYSSLTHLLLHHAFGTPAVHSLIRNFRAMLEKACLT